MPDEPTDLPEGTVVRRTIDIDDDLDESKRALLHQALSRSIAQANAGNLIDAGEVIGKLLARGEGYFTPEVGKQVDGRDRPARNTLLLRYREFIDRWRWQPRTWARWIGFQR